VSKLHIWLCLCIGGAIYYGPQRRWEDLVDAAYFGGAALLVYHISTRLFHRSNAPLERSARSDDTLRGNVRSSESAKGE